MDQIAFVPVSHGLQTQTSPNTSPAALQTGGQHTLSGKVHSNVLLTTSVTSGLLLAAVTSTNRRRGVQNSRTTRDDNVRCTSIALGAFESELGVQAPVGYWDPLGLSADGDVATFRRRRTTEIKHGRICMLATMGYITPELTGKFPGYLSNSLDLKFADIPNGLAAVSKVPGAGWLQIVAYCLYCEATGGFGYNSDNQASAPGDCGWKPPFLATDDPDLKTKRLNAELANGRLAMMAIIGMFFQDGLTGSAWGDWANYTDSPLRAFEFELGSQAPLGFWDPLGLSADGDIQKFKRRRGIEFKHGRVSMLATLGYMVPEYGKFPGYLSPSQDLKFADIPNGLAAISKVPTLGWVQILCFAGFIEGKGGLQWNNENPGDIGWKVISSKDPEMKAKKLAADLSNGRLAMFAIMGMFFQDGLTGSAWGDWDLYVDSPLRAFESELGVQALRAFENELGVQAPVGYWDPLGLSKDGDADVFRRRRESEIKHGRIAMIASVGYIVTGLGYRFPGTLSPSAGVSFSECPGGLEAIGAVPALGWAQWFIFCGLIDFGLYRQDPARGPGDFENGGILGVPNASGPMSDAEGRKRKLNSELANGRLAMFAIMGMLFQNGWVGSSGPEMWGF